MTGGTSGRHCEERSDEAIHGAARGRLDCFASLAMTVESGPLRCDDLLALLAEALDAERHDVADIEELRRLHSAADAGRGKPVPPRAGAVIFSADSRMGLRPEAASAHDLCGARTRDRGVEQPGSSSGS